MDAESKQDETIHPATVSTPAPPQVNQLQPKTEKPAPWQERLLPLMSGMLIALTAFFFVVTFVQMSYLHWTIFRSPPIQFDPASSQALLVSSNRFEDLYEARQFEVRAAMERYIVEKRYHQISVQLMSGLWLRYLGFITGMILALVGASFILGKLRVSSQELEGKYVDFSLSLRTTSPGIFLAVLGVILMFTTLVDRDVYEVNDGNIYLQGLAPVTIPSPKSIRELPQLPEYGGGSTDGSILPTPTPNGSALDAGTPTMIFTPEPGVGP